MEELIAQLLRQRSAQTIQAANAQHQAVLQSLAKPVSAMGDMADQYRRQEKHDRMYAGMRPEDLVTFYRDHPDLVPHGVSEREGYAQLDASRKGQGTWTLQTASPDELEALNEKNDLSLNMYGEPTQRPAITAGDGSNTAAAKGLDPLPDAVTSGDAEANRQLYAKPLIQESPFEVDRGAYPGAVYRTQYDRASDMLSRESINRDDDVQQTGWIPSDFNGMSHEAAAALIADQLRTRRIRQMGEMSPDYLQTLPQY